jgi:polar amino acid transport system substrate-binding protein
MTLRQALNAELRAFIGTSAHQDLVAPFGFTPAELPGTTSTDTLLATCLSQRP